MKNGTSIMNLYIDMISTLDKTNGLTLITFEIFFCYGLDRSPACYFASWLADDTHIPVVLCSEIRGHTFPPGRGLKRSGAIGMTRNRSIMQREYGIMVVYLDLEHMTILSLPFIPRP